MSVILDGTDLHLVGAVGFDLFGDCFTHAEVLMAFAQVGRDADLMIHLNSPGGYTDQGEGIANAIKARAGRTVVVVTGVAMSAATIIACAADEIVMCQGAMWMVHEPQVTLLFADSIGVTSAANYQRLSTDAYAAAYAERTGKSDAEVRAWMKATTYFDADETVAAGFADRKSADVIDFAEAAPAYPYADHKIFAHAPERLVARAREKDWTLQAAKQPRASATASPGPIEETSMTDKERADQLAAELADVKATAKADADALAALKAEKEDRERHDAILALPEAEGREPMAKALAASKGMTADAAKSVLAAAPKATSASSAAEDAASLEARRLNGEGLNVNGVKPTAKGDKAILAAAVARSNKRR